MCFSFVGCNLNDVVSNIDKERSSSIESSKNIVNGNDEKSGNNIASSNDIELTLDNYDKYLVLDMDYGLGGERWDDFYNAYAYNIFEPNFTITGASNHFLYNDVVITIRFNGSYFTYTVTKSFDKTIDITGNVGGFGSYTTPIRLDFYIKINSLHLTYEVVSVSGSVTFLQ